MKKYFTIIIVSILLATHFSSFAQCSTTISGDSCISALLMANTVGNIPNTLEWYRDGILEQVRGKRNPNSTIAAGGGFTDASQFSGPRDVAVDKGGNLYVVDDGRQRVQKWAPGASEGITVAGGNGKGTALNQFFTPQGIAVDKAGNIYVSDDLMARVTKWIPGATAGIVVAGGNGEGSAANQLNGPQNIFVDTAGNIYIADRWNNRVQKWMPGATVGVTVAGGNGNGSLANQLSEPLDAAVDKYGNVYVVDYYNNRVQKWAPAAITGITVAGGHGQGTAANQFNFTTALSITADGSLYVRDQNNYRIQKWTPGAATGITVAGGNGLGGTPENNVGPGFGLFADTLENIYVPELFQNTVNRFVPAATAEMQYTAALTGSYAVLVKGENGCNAQSSEFAVSTTPPKPTRIYGSSNVSEGQGGLVYRVERTRGVTYHWTVPPDARIVAGQGYWGIRVKWGSTSGAVTVMASNVCGTSSLKQKAVYVTQTVAATSGNTAAENRQLSIYPNPVASIATVFFTSVKNTSYTLQVTDITGKTIVKKDGIAITGENKIHIVADHFEAGIYFIHILDNENGRRSASFVKG